MVLSIQAIDKRNQNIISSILGETKPGNCSQAEEKARTFYKSCIKERDIIVSEDLVNLQVNIMLKLISFHCRVQTIANVVTYCVGLNKKCLLFHRLFVATVLMF